MSADHRLPDGKGTTSKKKYLKAWRELTEPLESALGLRTIGFDPGLLMADKDRGGVVEIPVWLARRIINKAKMAEPVAEPVERMSDANDVSLYERDKPLPRYAKHALDEWLAKHAAVDTA